MENARDPQRLNAGWVLRAAQAFKVWKQSCPTRSKTIDPHCECTGQVPHFCPNPAKLRFARVIWLCRVSPVAKHKVDFVEPVWRDLKDQNLTVSNKFMQKAGRRDLPRSKRWSMPIGALEKRTGTRCVEPVRAQRGQRSLANKIPVSTEKMMIDTPLGGVSLMSLRVGGRVQTRDNGLQSVAWMGTRGLTTRDLTRDAHLCPIHIKAGALGRGAPFADVTVLQNQRVFAARAQSLVAMERDFDMVPAKHLVGLPGIQMSQAPWFTMRYAMFERHQIIQINGIWVESVQPADTSRFERNNSQVLELKEVFSYCATKRGSLPSKEIDFPNYKRSWTEVIS